MPNQCDNGYKLNDDGMCVKEPTYVPPQPSGDNIGGTIGVIVFILMAIGAVYYVTMYEPANVVPVSQFNGFLDLRITDAPGQNITSLVLGISGVRVHFDGGTDAKAGWVSVNEQPLQYDLIQLHQRAASELMGTTQLPAGSYSQIRLDVDSAYLTTADGGTYQVTIPSNELKITNGFNIETGKRLVLTLDFDAGASVHSTGVGDYMLRPTVTVKAENVACVQDSDCLGYSAATTCGSIPKCVSMNCETVNVPCPTTTTSAPTTTLEATTTTIA